MEALLQQAMTDIVALRKTSVPWTLDKPHTQSYYTFDSTEFWVSKPASAGTAQIKDSAMTTIALYTWNIDFMLPFAEARMKPALAHLEKLTKSLAPATATVICIQECTPSDFTTISNMDWVRERFHLTDVDHTNWATTHYGTIMLVDSRLPISSVFRVHYSKTLMDRDALFVDVSLGNKTTRLCNTHLESLALDPPFRPAQMQLIARYMREDGVHAALVAGDFNAIQPFDHTLHVDNDRNLKDAFLEMGGEEDTEEGFTWGQQAATALRKQFGCSRMDKVYYRGDVELVRFERFGEDVMVAEGEEEIAKIKALGFEKPWVTDHLGVMAEVKVGLEVGRL